VSENDTFLTQQGWMQSVIAVTEEASSGHCGRQAVMKKDAASDYSRREQPAETEKAAFDAQPM